MVVPVRSLCCRSSYQPASLIQSDLACWVIVPFTPKDPTRRASWLGSMKFKPGKNCPCFFMRFAIGSFFLHFTAVFFAERSWPWCFFLCFSSFNCRRFFFKWSSPKNWSQHQGFQLKNTYPGASTAEEPKNRHISAMFLGLSLMIEPCVSSALWVLSAKKSSHSAVAKTSPELTSMNRLEKVYFRKRWYVTNMSPTL